MPGLDGSILRRREGPRSGVEVIVLTGATTRTLSAADCGRSTWVLCDYNPTASTLCGGIGADSREGDGEAAAPRGQPEPAGAARSQNADRRLTDVPSRRAFDLAATAGDQRARRHAIMVSA